MYSLVQILKVICSILGIDPRHMLALKFFPKFLKDLYFWKKSGGRINKIFPILTDYSDAAGTASGHYFHQDLLVARLIYEHGPKRHIDVGSRVDGFVAHLACFRQVEVLDFRPMPDSEHENLLFTQADLMNTQDNLKTDSLSCLHALEHFGLGRYGDPINIHGDLKGLISLIDMLNDNGRFYVSFPISACDAVHFNAHRVYNPRSILGLNCVKENLKLLRFDFVDDNGRLHTEADVNDDFTSIKYGCGIYTFEKRKKNDGCDFS